DTLAAESGRFCARERRLRYLRWLVVCVPRRGGGLARSRFVIVGIGWVRFLCFGGPLEVGIHNRGVRRVRVRRRVRRGLHEGEGRKGSAEEQEADESDSQFLRGHGIISMRQRYQVGEVKTV